ncbi:MAG TPA: hypothetical protein VGD62_10735 [Acidobacteriaceae bacterium]
MQSKTESFAVRMPRAGEKKRWAAGLLAACALGAACCYGQAPDPVALVKNASYNELKAGNKGHPFRYRLHKVDDGKVTTKIIVETKEGDIARLIEVDDKPLTPEANQAELDRLNNLHDHPELQARRHKREQEDGTRENEMVRLLPDAFLYQYVGMVEGPNGPAYRLSFKPNPNFTPPDREAEVYHGMEGELWIDKAQERMVKLDTHLIADVNFGWGILGKLYKGGSILVEQTDVGNQHWEASHMKLNLTGKALMLKPLSFQTTEDASDFHAVPDAGYKEAIALVESLK